MKMYAVYNPLTKKYPLPKGTSWIETDYPVRLFVHSSGRICSFKNDAALFLGHELSIVCLEVNPSYKE